jgi:hypothetical protein
MPLCCSGMLLLIHIFDHAWEFPGTIDRYMKSVLQKQHAFEQISQRIDLKTVVGK